MYENVTYEVILQRMLECVPDQFDKREGSVIWDTHSPTAIELQILYLELDTILREAFGDTASREFLILRCRERGISPYAATRAVLRGVFVPSGIDVTGQRFNIGDINYLVTEKISEDEYRVECETAGRIGNQFLGSMIPMEYIRGLQSAKLVEVLIPGEDEEAPEDLRKRYFDSFRESAFGGNVRDYLEKTNGIPGVGRTKVTRVWNCDISPAAMIPAPEVERWYEGIRDSVSGEAGSWLDAVYRAGKARKLTTGGTVLLTILDSEFGAASSALIDTVQNIIDPGEKEGEGCGLAPIGHVVTVESAKAVELHVRADMMFEAGYEWDQVQGPVLAAVSDYFLELRRTWADVSRLVVRISQIETRILGVSGILDIRQTTVNGSEENLVLGEYEVPVLGGVEL